MEIMAKAEFCNREPANIAGYMLKKDVEKLTLDEFKQINKYNI